MRTIEIKKDQSLADIALQEYGDVQGLFMLVDDNADILNGITDTLHKGDKLQVRNAKINRRMQEHLSEYALATAKGARGEGIGYWGVDRDFIITS